MIGSKIQEMKMRFNELEDVSAESIQRLRPKDIVEIDTIFEDGTKYLILKIGKLDKYIRALPLGEYIKNKTEYGAIPVLDIPFYMIKRCQKLDNSMLLFLINHNNPHILEALDGMVNE